MTNIFERKSIAQRRVVITGISAITPLGLDINKSWASLIESRSGVGKITQYDDPNIEVQIAGEVKGFEASDYVEKKDIKKMDRFIPFALAASDHCLKDSGLELSEQDSHQAGCIIGVGLGGLNYISKQQNILSSRGPSRISPFFIPSVIANLAAGHVSMRHKLRYLNYAVTSACSSGAHAIGEAFNYIRNGKCKVMIAGGSEAVVTPLAVAGFNSMKALSTRNSSPTEASRPWDQDRDGFVLAEGASLFVLEDYEYASKRGAKIYAEVIGYGASSDAHHMTTPSPGGVGAAMSMQNALNDAELNPEQINYINAHGTSTPAGDIVECEAVKKVFGGHAKSGLWVSSTKSAMGHALGAAGAIESAFCVKAIEDQVAPPTINLDNPSPECDLDFIPEASRRGELNYVLNNSFGFGGTNASLIFGKMN